MAVTRVEALVWAEWAELDEACETPVKSIAQRLGMAPADVAFIVYPAETFGAWRDDQEPDLTR